MVLVGLTVVVVTVAMTLAPKDGCGSWPEQLNPFETSDLCRGFQ